MARKTVYTDRLGRKTLVILPDDAPDGDAYMGVPIGPPSLDALGLPSKVQTRLHNELFHRQIFSIRDAKQRPNDITGALMAALKLDAATIMSIYSSEGVASA